MLNWGFRVDFDFHCAINPGLIFCGAKKHYKPSFFIQTDSVSLSFFLSTRLYLCSFLSLSLLLFPSPVYLYVPFSLSLPLSLYPLFLSNSFSLPPSLCIPFSLSLSVSRSLCIFLSFPQFSLAFFNYLFFLFLLNYPLPFFLYHFNTFSLCLKWSIVVSNASRKFIHSLYSGVDCLELFSIRRYSTTIAFPF